MVEQLGLSRGISHSYQLTLGKLYTVLALTMVTDAVSTGAGVQLDVVDEFGRWSVVPLLLFEIEDPRPSGHWVAKKMGERELALWPESFYGHCYHDRLTDGVPEVVADFERVRALLEAEANGDQPPEDVIQQLKSARVKISIRGKEEHVLLEGSPVAMELLGRLLIAQARNEKEWWFQLDRQNKVLNEESTHGLFLHVIRDETGK